MSKLRKATFTKTDTGEYAPVNRLAHELAEGYATLPSEDVQAIARNKLARPYIWTDGGLRQSFRR